MEITSFTHNRLIGAAFDLEPWQLSGGEEWMTKQLYDIQAQPPQIDPPPTYDVRHTGGGIATTPTVPRQTEPAPPAH